MRIGFAGTPWFAANILEQLIDSNLNVVRCYTQPSRRSGRGGRLQPSPVFKVAENSDIEVLTPLKLRPLSSKFMDLDALIVAAYGLILPANVLNAPRLGCFNVHASLLPRWRGAAPIEHAILAGDEQTGVSVMEMTQGLDEGPVYSKATYKLRDTDTLESVTSALSDLGAKEISAFLGSLSGEEVPQPEIQDEKLVTYAPKLDNAAERIDWSDPAQLIERQIRAFVGRGLAFATMSQVDESLRVSILESQVRPGHSPAGKLVQLNKKSMAVGCGKDLLELKQVQVNRGKGKVLAIQDAMNGYAAVFNANNRFDIR